jgi:hypothetical protein
VKVCKHSHRYFHIVDWVRFLPTYNLHDNRAHTIIGVKGATYSQWPGWRNMDLGSVTLPRIDAICNNPISIVNLVKITLLYPLLRCY